jgi:hypothetical protein
VSVSRQSRSPLSPRTAAGLSVLVVQAALPASVIAVKGSLAVVRAGVLRDRGCGAPRPAAPSRRAVAVDTRAPWALGPALGHNVGRPTSRGPRLAWPWAVRAHHRPTAPVLWNWATADSA